MKFKIFISICISIIILVMLTLKKPDNRGVIKPKYYLTASELISYFKLDEELGDKKFGNKLIQVTGTILNITYNNRKPIITINANNQESNVVCYLNSSEFTYTTNLKKNKNDTIILQGKCTGFLLDVIMTDCIIIKNKKHEK